MKQSPGVPPELAPDRFNDIKLPIGWIQCPLEFSEPIGNHRILVCKTPIDEEIAEYLKIPKEKYFLPHTIYTLPRNRNNNICNIGLVVDLTNQMFYDEISFNNGKKTNKVKRRIITMNNLLKPTEAETSGFIGLLKSFLDATSNQDKWCIIHDDLGYNLSGFMCSAFMVKELNYSVDAAVYQFNHTRKPGIFNPNYIRLLHEMYSDKEDLEEFEQSLKIKPLLKPKWIHHHKKEKKEKKEKKQEEKQENNKMIKKKTVKRSFSEMSDSSFLSEPELNIINNNNNNNNKSTSNIIMEPRLLEPIEPKIKKQRLIGDIVDVPRELKYAHSYLIAVRDQHLQHLTTIIFQLSKNNDLFHSIQSKTATVPQTSLMTLSTNYRISWLGNGYKFWLMILGKMGCFFVDPSFFSNGKLGGIYHIEGTYFYNDKTNKYMDGTLCCGELVIDEIITDKKLNKIKKVPRFLITDMLVFDKQSLLKFTHPQRLMRAQNYLYKPFIKSLKTSKLRIRVKPMYKIENKQIINKLQIMIKKELPHKCNGLGLFPIKPPFGQRILRIAI